MAKMGTVWDRTAEFLSDNLGAILPVALLAFFVPASISGSFQPILQSADYGLALTLLLFQLAFAVLSLWGWLTIIVMALDMPDTRQAGAIARGRLLAALSVWVALFGIVLLLFSVVPLILAAGGIDLTEVARMGPVAVIVAAGGSSSANAAAWIAGGYFVLLLLALGWLYSRLFVTDAVIVRERRMFSALRQSWKLTRRMGWRIIGVMLLYCLVSWVSILAANLVFGSIFALVAGGPAEGISLAGVLTSVVVAAVQTGFTVLAPAFTAKLYLALTAEAGLREGVLRA